MMPSTFLEEAFRFSEEAFQFAVKPQCKRKSEKRSEGWHHFKVVCTNLDSGLNYGLDYMDCGLNFGLDF